MKNTLILLLLLFPILAFAQYPATGNKMRLGWQTTGDGLVYRDAGAPSYTPNSRNNAYMYLDTVAQRLYRYTGGAWRDLSDEKYMSVQNSSVLAADVKDTLTIYDRLFVAMELTSAVGGNRGVQLPVTGLDSTYAGRVVRVSPLDSSSTYNVFVSSSSPDGLLVDGVLQTSYDLESDETVEFQLYVFDTIYQWRLIHTSKTNDVVLPDSLIYGKGDPNWVAVFSQNDSTIKAGNIRDDGVDITFALPEVAYGIDDTSTPDAGTYGYNGATGRFAYYNAGWRNLISGNVTQNYLMRADANGNAVNAGLIDDGTFLQLDRPVAFKSYTTAGLPTGVENRFLWNSTLKALGWYNGTRYAYAAESTQPTFTSYNIVAPNANGQLAILSGDGSYIKNPAYALQFTGINNGQRNTLSLTEGQLIYNSQLARYEYVTAAGAWAPLSPWTALNSNSMVNSIPGVHIGTHSTYNTPTGLYFADGARVRFGTSGGGSPINSYIFSNWAMGLGTTNTRFMLSTSNERINSTYANSHKQLNGWVESSLFPFSNFGLNDNIATNASTSTGLMAFAGNSLIRSATFNVLPSFNSGTTTSGRTGIFGYGYTSSSQQTGIGVIGFSEPQFVLSSTSGEIYNIGVRGYARIKNVSPAGGTGIFKNIGVHGKVIIESTTLPGGAIDSYAGYFEVEKDATSTRDLYGMFIRNGDTYIGSQNIVLDSLNQNDTISKFLVLNPTDKTVHTRDVSTISSYTGFIPSADATVGDNVASGGTLSVLGGFGVNTSVSGTTVTVEADTSASGLATQYDVSLKQDQLSSGSFGQDYYYDGDSNPSLSYSDFNSANALKLANNIGLQGRYISHGNWYTGSFESFQNHYAFNAESAANNGTYFKLAAARLTGDTTLAAVSTNDAQFGQAYSLSAYVTSPPAFNNGFYDYISIGSGRLDSVVSDKVYADFAISQTLRSVGKQNIFSSDWQTRRITLGQYGDGIHTASSAEINAGYIPIFISGTGEIKEAQISALPEKQSFTLQIYDGDAALPDSSTAAGGLILNKGFFRVPERMDGWDLNVSFGIFDFGTLTSTHTYSVSLTICDGSNANCTNGATANFTISSERELSPATTFTVDANDIVRVNVTAPSGCDCGTETVNGLTAVYTLTSN